jgi:hypothetical protein
MDPKKVTLLLHYQLIPHNKVPWLPPLKVLSAMPLKLQPYPLKLMTMFQNKLLGKLQLVY